MQAIYHANNEFTAQLVVDLLRSEGIDGRIHGAYLAGAAGDLPVGGLVRVMVADADAERASAIVARWDALPVPTDAEMDALSEDDPVD
jgi:predicted dehydrogenase